MKSLDGRVALVTGAGRGIGQGTALKLADAGARLVVNDLDQGPLDDTLAMLERSGAPCVGVAGDITAPDFAERFTAVAVENFGAIDIVVNNAGWIWDGVIQNLSDEQFQAMLDVHLVAPFRILRAAIEHIRPWAKAEAAAGEVVHRKVVNVTSTSGVAGAAGQANYASAKSGLIGLTKTLSREWGRYNINVNCVAFGIVETRGTMAYAGDGASILVGEREVRVGMPKEMVASLESQVPLGRFGTPDDAAGAIYLLCLPESDYISGQVLQCSGGALE